MIKDKVRILAIEDNPADVRLIDVYLKDRPSFGYDLISAGTMKEGIERLANDAFSVILLDLNLPDSKGLEGLERIAVMPGIPPIIVLTGLNDEETGRQAIMKDAQDYIVKDNVDGDNLVRTIRYSMERHRLKEALNRTNAELQNRAAQLLAANEGLDDSRRSALTLLEEAILARGQAESANALLRANEDRIRTALRNTPISVMAQDRDLRILWIYNHLAQDASTVIGRTDHDIFPSEEAAHLSSIKNKVIETGDSAREKLHLTFDGERLLVDLYLEPFIEKDGRISGIGSVAIDMGQIDEPE
jgi:CheY-like chemotaxis protein